jgi:hypothetical protein
MAGDPAIGTLFPRADGQLIRRITSTRAAENFGFDGAPIGPGTVPGTRTGPARTGRTPARQLRHAARAAGEARGQWKRRNASWTMSSASLALPSIR